MNYGYHIQLFIIHYEKMSTLQLTDSGLVA